jgi:hypothetical protein
MTIAVENSRGGLRETRGSDHPNGRGLIVCGGDGHYAMLMKD